MKRKYNRWVGLACLATVLFTSCEMKNELWGKDPGEVMTENEGKLDFTLKVEAPDWQSSATRSARTDEVPDAKDFGIVISNSQSLPEVSFATYADYLQHSPYKLPVGTYYVEAVYGSGAFVSRTPYYQAVDTVEVASRQIVPTTATAVLRSALFDFALSDQFLAAVTDDYCIIVTSTATGSVMTLTKDEAASLYIRPESGYIVTVKATDKATGQPVVSEIELGEQEVKQQTIFEVAVDIEEMKPDTIPDVKPDPTPDPTPDPDPKPDPEPEPDPKPSNGSFQITVDVTVNGVPVTITVPSIGSGNTGGSTDPGTGGGSGTGGSDSAITFTGDAVNSDLVVNVPAGIQKLEVTIDSPLLSKSELESVGLTDQFDLAAPGQYADKLSALGFPVNIGGKTSVTFNISSFVPLLGALGHGTSQFILKVTDMKGATATKTLTVTV